MYSKEWFFTDFFPTLENFYEVKYLEEPGDFGMLRGVQFESEMNGGYLYFWENGFVGVLLFDYQSDDTLIGDALFDDYEVSKSELVKLVSILSDSITGDVS